MNKWISIARRMADRAAGYAIAFWNVAATPKGSKPTRKKRNFLAIAAKSGPTLNILDLLNAGHDPNESGKDGLTPLMVAAREVRVEAVRVLLPVADAKKTCLRGATALMRAANARCSSEAESQAALECVRLLLPASDPNAKSHKGNSALTLAVEAGNAEIAKLLAIASEGGAFGAATQAALEMALEKGSWAVANALGEVVSPDQARKAVDQFLRNKAPRIAALCEASDLAGELKTNETAPDTASAGDIRPTRPKARAL